MVELTGRKRSFRGQLDKTRKVWVRSLNSPADPKKLTTPLKIMSKLNLRGRYFRFKLINRGVYWQESDDTIRIVIHVSQ